MFSITSARYFLYQEPTDMRKSFDGQNPMSGDLFIFVNKPRNRIKLLRREPGGFVLFYKRLEKGTFHLPKPATDNSKKQQLDYSQLVMITNGIYLEKAKKYRRFSPQNAVGNFSLNTT
jgi:transposase